MKDSSRSFDPVDKDKRVPLMVLQGDSTAALAQLLIDAFGASQSWPGQDRWAIVADSALRDVDGIFSHPDMKKNIRFLSGLGLPIEGSCLCCGLNSELGDILRGIFLTALTRKPRGLSGVLLVTGRLDPSLVKFTLRHAPFLGQRYKYAGAWRVVVGQSPSLPLLRQGTDVAVDDLPVPNEGLEGLLRNTVH